MLGDFLIAGTLGSVAGLLDAAPMLRMAVPRFSVYSTFLQWVVLGLLIPFVDWGLSPWLQGLLIGVLGMIPSMAVLYYRNRRAIVTTALAGAVLGAAIGLAGGVLIR